MRAVLWDLLLLWLCARARGDCRGDCLHCDRDRDRDTHRDTFDVLICILECEGQAVPRATWELCAAAAASRAAPRSLRFLSGRPWPGSAAEPPRRDQEEEEEEREEEEEQQGKVLDISRRLWAGRAAKGVQKRYGGFIGVRKSARKWNNQKRFSEFLRQYLGMAPRSTFRRRLPTRQRPN